MTDELKAKVIAYNKQVARKAEMAADLEIVLERLHGVYAALSPLIPESVKAVFEKYDYGEV